ncbi:MAG: serine hydrolase, partial [Candidatus Omnitrophica bacterium]|nr:serine hydrolase [Candidatus Omnitrophota bacterium]
KRILGLIMVIFLFGTVNSFAQGNDSVPDAQKLKQILADFEEYAQKTMNEWKIPGMAVAIVQNDSVVYAKGFGVKVKGGSDPVTPHTIFQIGSTTKAFTAALVAMLVDEEKIKWKDRVVDCVPDFRMYDPWVTREFMILDLLAQHSGLPAYSGDFQSFCGFDRAHIKRSLAFIKPVSSFRSEFAYVNHLFLVAAEVVEKKTGKSWEENIKERIFVPLDMSESSADVKALVDGRNVATGHNVQNDSVTVVSKALDWPYIYGPAGGINSNVIDMSTWLRLQINDGILDGRRLINEDSMNFMHSPKTIAQYDAKKELGTYYCQSWVYVDTRPYPFVWHNGGTTGYHSMIAFWPEPKIGIVILTNESTNKLAEALPKYFADLYFGAPKQDYSKEALAEFNKLKVKEQEEAPKKPEITTPSLSLDKYAGTYSNDVYGNATVAVQYGTLSVFLGPRKFELVLKHWDRDTFTYSHLLMGDGFEDFVHFTQGTDGSVKQMTIDVLQQDGCGVFERVEEKKPQR